MPAESEFQSAVEFIRTQAKCGPVLILGPTTEAADDLARAACDSAMLGVYRMSLAQLAVSIAEPILAAENRTRLDYVGAEALAYSVAREVLARLDYFRSIADSPGFPRALSRTLSDLRMAGVRPEQPVAVADISLLLSRWEAALEQRGLADLASVYEIAAQAIPGSPFNGHALVEIDLQPRTLAERELLTAVRTSARAVHRSDTAGRPIPPSLFARHPARPLRQQKWRGVFMVLPRMAPHSITLRFCCVPRNAASP